MHRSLCTFALLFALIGTLGAAGREEPDATPRRLGAGASRLATPNSWYLVPDSYTFRDREFELHLLGYLKFDLMADIESLGLGADSAFVNEFITGQIPPKGTQAARRDGRVGFTVNNSRVEFGLRTSAPHGPVGALIDINFGRNISGGPRLDLRQLFASWGSLRAGKSWTTFLDLQSIPDTLDYEGPNAIPETRQVMGRWTQPLAVGPAREVSFLKPFSVLLAAEEPGAQMTLAGGVSALDQVPDFVAGIEYAKGNASILLAGLYRRFRAKGGQVDETANGWGLTVNGNLPTWGSDSLQFGAVVGRGLGRYIQDTQGMGLDAALDGSGNLKPIGAFGAWLGYQHWWTPWLRSTASYGYVNLSSGFVTSTTDVPAEAGVYKRAHYVSANLIASPIPPLDLGIEYLFGERRTAGGRSGQNHRIHVSLILHFGSGPRDDDASSSAGVRRAAHLAR